MLPIELTDDEIKNTKAYKEYYAYATGEAAPKPKASARRKMSGSDTSITPPTTTTTLTTTVAVTPRLTATPRLRLLRKSVLPAEVLIRTTSVLPPVATLSQSTEITFKSVNAQLEAEVLTRSSHSSRTSYAVAIDLSKMELKKILIEKIEGNKSIQRSDKQRNLYKALVDAYEADKIILDSYGETIILKRRRKEPESASASLETATRSAGRSTTGSKSRQVSASESAFAEEPVQTISHMDEPSYPPKKPPTPDRAWNKTLPAVQGNTQTWISKLEKQVDSRSSFNELLDTPLYFSNFIMNWLRVYTLTPKLLAGPTFELIKGSYTSLIELEYHLEEVYKETTDQLDWLNPEGQQYPHNLDVYTKHRHSATYGRSSTGSRKLPEEAQPQFELKRREAYTAYSNLRGFIYQNKDKKNRLMRIDELYKFSDGTLNDVRNALDDRLKWIRVHYLPQIIWRKGDKDRAAAMIQAIDKMLKTRRIMRSLERLVRGRLYEGDFRMLQRTI
nr:hypothetical protein [Tanacetum cinerariifolium]